LQRSNKYVQIYLKNCVAIFSLFADYTGKNCDGIEPFSCKGMKDDSA
jgi:hypothetical protein